MLQNLGLNARFKLYTCDYIYLVFIVHSIIPDGIVTVNIFLSVIRKGYLNSFCNVEYVVYRKEK